MFIFIIYHNSFMHTLFNQRNLLFFKIKNQYESFSQGSTVTVIFEKNADHTAGNRHVSEGFRMSFLQPSPYVYGIYSVTSYNMSDSQVNVLLITDAISVLCDQICLDSTFLP